MKKILIFLRIILSIFLIILFNCQQPSSGSSGSGGNSGDSSSSSSTVLEWLSQLKITASRDANDDFGNAVSISGDYAIVGAYYEDDTGTDSGVAYIFHRTGIDTWDTGVKLNLPAVEDNAHFGNAVSISGDYAIVGAPDKDGAETDCGTAYIFHRDEITGNWGTGLGIKSGDPEDSGHFGISVSISGNYAIVGAYNEDAGAFTNCGAAYIFHRDEITGDWDAGVEITASDAADTDLFGHSVSISGDYAIVGAYFEDEGAVNGGAVYAFRRTGTNTWVQSAKIITPDTEINDQFGYSVSISGDYIIAGAHQKDGGGSFRGAAYIFHRMDIDTWDTGMKIVATDPGDEDRFGKAVAISGDYAIVGAMYENGSGVNRGAAYIYHRIGTNTWNSGQKIIASDTDDNCNFGNAVSILSDHAIVGAMCDGGTNFGAAYILNR